MIDFKEDFKATKEQAVEHLQKILDCLTFKFTINYSEPQETLTFGEDFYQVNVDFFERKSKLPTPVHKVTLCFKVPKSLQSNDFSFQVEHESVFYPLFSSINLHLFQSLLDRVINDKIKMSKHLLLQTNFESTRLLTLNGEQLKLYTIEEDENIFSNNNAEYFTNNFTFTQLELKQADELIKILWKTLDKTEDGCISFEQFRLIFVYGKLNMNEENLKKLWKYAKVQNLAITKKQNMSENLNYADFSVFILDLIQCLRYYTISKFKQDNNNFITKKIQKSVEIMNLHFKEKDFSNSEEISYEDLRNSLLKENELFTRKQIEIILKQINPNQNFQFWKFDKILEILFTNHFDYQQLMKEDKIYKYLIEIFTKQDELKEGNLHYRKMKQAFLTESKLKMNKTQILFLLNFFDINSNPVLDYYKASLIIRNIIEDLFTPDTMMQKIDITQEEYQTYTPFEDIYDGHIKNIKEIFISFDKDYDHLLSDEEFRNFLRWLIPYITTEEENEIFQLMDLNKDGKVNYKEFKRNFENLMKLTRIKNVIKTITSIV